MHALYYYNHIPTKVPIRVENGFPEPSSLKNAIFTIDHK